METLTETRQTAPKILLAEDDDDLRVALTSLLEADGYDVTSVASGRALMSELWDGMASSRPPSLVISDERMPGGRGLFVMRWAREHGVNVPLVLMTAFEDEDIAREAQRLRAALFSKPLDADSLREMVKWSRHGLPSTRLACASCGTNRNLSVADPEQGVFYCRDCRRMNEVFETGDGWYDVGGDGE